MNNGNYFKNKQIPHTESFLWILLAGMQQWVLEILSRKRNLWDEISDLFFFRIVLWRYFWFPPFHTGFSGYSTQPAITWELVGISDSQGHPNKVSPMPRIWGLRRCWEGARAQVSEKTKGKQGTQLLQWTPEMDSNEKRREACAVLAL